MIKRFPYEEAWLARTRLRYVRLDRVLHDGKADRSVKAPAVVAIYLGERTDLIFLAGGEPITAATVERGSRCPVTIASVLARARAEDERGEVGFFRVAPPQLLAMWSCMAAPPTLEPDPEGFGASEELLRWAREAGFDGILELEAAGSFAYLRCSGGRPIEGFFPGRAAGAAVAEGIAALLEEGRGEPLRAAGYRELEEVPTQAPAALSSLYTRTATRAVKLVGVRIGLEEAVDCFRGGLERARERHPLLAAYSLGEGGRVEGDQPVATADGLTDAFAAWLFDAVGHAARAMGDDPADVVRGFSREQRYALEAQRFFDRFPWPVDF